MKSDGTEIVAVAGDILQCGGDSESVNCIVEEYVKALFIVYPQTEEDLFFVRKKPVICALKFDNLITRLWMTVMSLALHWLLFSL